MVHYTADEQAANRAKLVAALRSGDYEQGQNYLRQQHPGEEPEYCCLGVACAISGLGRFDNLDMFITTAEGESSSTHLPGAVRKWLGFDSDNGALDDGDVIGWGEDHARVLTDANDNGVPFATIADVIEEGRVKIV